MKAPKCHILDGHVIKKKRKRKKVRIKKGQAGILTCELHVFVCLCLCVRMLVCVIDGSICVLVCDSPALRLRPIRLCSHAIQMSSANPA